MLTRSQYKKIKRESNSSDSFTLFPLRRRRPSRRLQRRRRVCNAVHPLSRLDAAKAVYFKRRTVLNRFYNPEDRMTYLHQIYNVHEKLGEGSYGVVHRISTKRGKRKFALKMFKCNPVDLSNQEGMAEICSWEKVQSHANIVQLIYAWEQRHKLFMVTELCAGTLHEYRAINRHIEEAEQWDVLLDMLSALKHLESRGLLHNDIKPDNILIDTRGVYKLADFGLINDWSGQFVRDRYVCTQDIYDMGATMILLTSAVELNTSKQLPPEIDEPDYRNIHLRDLARSINPVIMIMIDKCAINRQYAVQLLKHRAVRPKFEIQMSTPRVNHYARWKSNR